MPKAMHLSFVKLVITRATTARTVAATITVLGFDSYIAALVTWPLV